MGLLQVIVATVATQVIGMVWYSDQVPTGQVWMKHSNVRGGTSMGKGNVPLLVAFVCKILLCLLLDDRFRFVIAGASYVATAEKALWLSVIPGLCLVTHSVFSGEGWQAILVHVMYDAACFVAIALIIVHL